MKFTGLLNLQHIINIILKQSLILKKEIDKFTGFSGDMQYFYLLLFEYWLSGIIILVASKLGSKIIKKYGDILD